MGCSYSRPGQSGITKCWSEHLQDILGVPVINLTWKSGGSNSEILREITQYVWNNDVSSTAFIVQWTTIDRTEFCYEDDVWIQVRAMNLKNNAKVSEEQYEISKTLLRAQALSYSTTTYFWEWIQKVLCLDLIMKSNNCKYFQWHMTGTDVNNISSVQYIPWRHRLACAILEDFECRTGDTLPTLSASSTNLPEGWCAHAPLTYLRLSSGTHNDTITYVLMTSRCTQITPQRR